MSIAESLQNTATKSQLVSNSSHPGLLSQSKCACGGSPGLAGECEACKKKRLQKKLSIGASNDPLEQEADRVADQVLAPPPSSRVSGAAPRIQRFTGQATSDTGTAPASVDRVLSGASRPLDISLQKDMGSRFGYDFSNVRVHTGSAADESAREVNAHAYTVGHNIVFGAGQFAPGSYTGRRLIAHELTHVVQQSAGFDAMLLQRSSGSGKCSSKGVPCAAGSNCEKPDRDAMSNLGASSAWALTVNIDTEASSWYYALLSQSFGHAFVRFAENSGRQFSYGFYPAGAGPNEITRSVPGCVHHPDITHDSCTDRQVTYSLQKPQYDAALAVAKKICRKPRDYGEKYTCATYAIEVAQAAGQSIPSPKSEPTMVSYQLVPGIDNPNTLKERVDAEVQTDPKKKGFWNVAKSPVLRLQPVSPIKLDGDPNSPVFKLDWLPTGEPTFRWRLYDSNNRHYLMRGAEGAQDVLDWLSFTDSESAIVGRKTRDLLKQRGEMSGSVQCSVRFAVQGWKDQNLALPVSFA